MRLTPAGKLLLVLVGLGVLGYAGWTYRTRLPLGGGGSAGTTAPSSSTGDSDRPGATGERAASGAPRTGVLASVRQSGVLRVGMEPDAAPLHFINDRKQEDGFDFRLAAIIAQSIGAQRVQVVEADYEDLPDRIRAGDIDIIM